jgi:PEP-CTERM motif
MRRVRTNKCASDVQFLGECGAVFYAGGAIAYGDQFGLHASGSITALATANGPPNSALGEGNADASVGLTDKWHFGGSHPQFANEVLTISVSGVAQGAADTGGFTQISVFDPIVGLSLAPECDVFGAGQCTLRFRVNLNDGVETVIDLIAQAHALLGPGTHAGDTAFGFADFSHTAWVSGLSFFDLTGAPLALSFTTDSGLTYPMAQAPNGIPEPAILPLMGLGLAGLGFSRRRKSN